MSYFYQGAAPCLIFDASGKDPAKRYRLKTSGAVRRGFDASTKGYIWCIEGGPATRLSIGETSHARTGGFRIIHKAIIFQLLLPPGDQRPFALELLVTDTAHNRRRILLSTAFASLSKTPLHAQVPLGDALNKYRGKWFHWVIDLTTLVQHAFGKSVDFDELIGLSIRPSCMLRTVFSVRDGCSSVPENAGGDFLSWRPLPEAQFPPNEFSDGPSMTVNGCAPRVDNQNSPSNLPWKRRRPVSSIHIAFGSRCESKITTSAKDAKHATRSVSAKQRSTNVAASRRETPVSACRPNASADCEPEKERIVNEGVDHLHLKAIDFSSPTYTTVGTTAAGASLDFQRCNSNPLEGSHRPCHTILQRIIGEDEENVSPHSSENTVLPKKVDHVDLPAEQIGNVESMLQIEGSAVAAGIAQLGSCERSPGAVSVSSLQLHATPLNNESPTDNAPPAEFDAMLNISRPVTAENRPASTYQSGSSSVLSQSVIAPAEPSATLGKTSCSSSQPSAPLSTNDVVDESIEQQQIRQGGLCTTTRVVNANVTPASPLLNDVQGLELDILNCIRNSNWHTIEAKAERADNPAHLTADSTNPNMLASIESCRRLHRVPALSIDAPTTVDSLNERLQERPESTDDTYRNVVAKKSKDLCNSLEISGQAEDPSMTSMESERRNPNFNQRIMLTACYGPNSSVNSRFGTVDDPPSYSLAISDSCHENFCGSDSSTTHSIAPQLPSCNDTMITRLVLDSAELETPASSEPVAHVGAPNSCVACSTASLPAALEEQMKASKRSAIDANLVHEKSRQALGHLNDVEPCSTNSVATRHQLSFRALAERKSVEVAATQAVEKCTGDKDNHDTDQTLCVSHSYSVALVKTTLKLNETMEPPPAYDDVTAVVAEEDYEGENGETIRRFQAHESTQSAPATMVALAGYVHSRLSESSHLSTSIHGTTEQTVILPSSSSPKMLLDRKVGADQLLLDIGATSSDQSGHLPSRPLHNGELEEAQCLECATAARLNSVELVARALPASRRNVEEKAPSTVSELTPLYSGQESGRHDKLQLLERKMSELAAMENSYLEEFGSLSLRSIPCQRR